MIKLERIEDYPGTGWSEVAPSYWLCPYHGSQLDSIDKVDGKLHIKFKPGTIMPKLPECLKVEPK